jgi:hypothetical protein
MIKHSLKKKTPAIITHSQPIDENAAELLADQLTAEEPALERAPAVESALVKAETSVAVSAGEPRLPSPAELGLHGEFTMRDIPVPQLRLIQGSGVMSRRFSVGSVVYNDEVLFQPHEASMKKPLFRFVVASFRKQFREHLNAEESASGMQPRTVNTLREALSLGGGVEWGPNKQKPRWSESAKMILLLEAPEGMKENPAFFFSANDTRYAPAVFYASNSAYRNFARQIISRAMITQRPVNTFFWTFAVDKVNSGNYSVLCPLAKLVPAPVPADVLDIATKFGGVVAADEE